MNAALLFDKSPMSTQQDGLAVYMAAIRALHSDDPAVRRPAISVLLELARRGEGAVRANAERELTREFGPFAVSEGLAGCSAPIAVVDACDGNCRACVWLWLEQPESEIEHAPVVPSDQNLQPSISTGCLPYKAVA